MRTEQTEDKEYIEPKHREEIAEAKSILLDKILADYNLAPEDVGHCVELYYDAQKLRIIHGNKQISKGTSPLRDWFSVWLYTGEKLLVRKLKRWVEDTTNAEAQWAYAQVGIGPVIAAGLSAMIDVNRLSRVSSLWKWAGLAPGHDRKVKGEKLEYNPRLKVLCYKIGECFVKTANAKGSFYGKLYVQFKEAEIIKNESGRYKEAAAKELASKKYKDDTKTKGRLLEGKLSDAHLHARAKRKTVKIFLSHFWKQARTARGLPVTEPYVKAYLHHEHMIEAPGPQVNRKREEAA